MKFLFGLISSFLLLTSLSANQALLNNWDKKDKYAFIESKNSSIYIYNYTNKSTSDFDRFKLQNILENMVCSDKEQKNGINSGHS